jgi:hypothetical protein
MTRRECGMTAEQADAMWGVLTEVEHERFEQHAKWGEQNHANGTGCDRRLDIFALNPDLTRERCERAFKDGAGTYAHILVEEVAEALAESDPAKLRAELLQIAAVAVQWIEKLDRDAARGGR